MDGAALAELMEEVEIQRRRLDAADVRLVAAAEQRRRDGQFASCTVVDLLINRLDIDPREATKRVNRADELCTRRTLTGTPLPPLLSSTAAALDAGEISAAHADVIARYAEKVDRLADVAPDGLEVAENLLVEASKREYPRLVARLGETLLARLDPDGTAPKDVDLDRERSYGLVKEADGSSTPRGKLTPEATAAWEALFDALAAPITDADGSPDPRSPAQRRHDAMYDAAKRLLRGAVPSGAGTPTTVLVRFPAGQLPTSMVDAVNFEWDADRVAAARDERVGLFLTGRFAELDGSHDLGTVGIGQTAHGSLISLSRLGCELCEAEIDATAVNDSGGVLAFGRNRRLASKTQRLALAARGGGCCFPGCTRPAAWTEAHHVQPWYRGGVTDLKNLCLLCSYHHRNFERLCWHVVMTDGVPMWIPPPWVDPERRPRRNTAHHLADFPA